MAEYQAPLRDVRFLLQEVFEVEKLWASMPALAETVDSETAEAILEEAAKICREQIAPLNRPADEQGCQWLDGEVSSPEGFSAAYKTFTEGGWGALAGEPAYGGMGMPKMLVGQVDEMLQGASMSFGLAPMLTAGACLAINAHGSDELKQAYLPKMYSGEWAGAMDLTEPHSGTDLGLIRTKAEPRDDGSYLISGTKIFITWGEHDMADNIIHLVLAKLPDAPAGARGISLFLVPKLLLEEDGSLGAGNGVSCGSIEKKMGIKASASCVMNYDQARGWLVGEPNKGLACMFTMMNYERLVVGIQGVGASQASYLNAVEYARDRLQGRAATGAFDTAKPADPILVHADVRRMLMTMRAYTEGARAFLTYTAKWLDLAKFSEADSDKAAAAQRVELLTPVAKAFVTDRSLDVCLLGQQVFGGHGYIREWGQEQLVRDVRISQIYEGTNGIQAMDLMGRKTVLSGGQLLQPYLTEIREFVVANRGGAMAEFSDPLLAQIDLLERVTTLVIEQAVDDADAVGAAANDYLQLFGLVSFAYMWALMAKAALDERETDGDFYRAKLATARFYFGRLLPQSQAFASSVEAGSGVTMGLTADSF